MSSNKLQKNIGKEYVFTFLSGFDITQGIWMLYLASRGLTLFQIGLMETVFHLTSFTMEIPTGAVADIYGRKTSRTIGRVLAVISMLIMIFGTSTYHYAISFMIYAISFNLESGAGEALIFDSMKELNIDDTYSKVRGRTEMIYQITRTISLLLGGYLATISYSNVYIAAAILAALSFIQSLFFTEPSIGKVERQHNIVRTFTKQIKDSFSIVKESKTVFETILLMELFGTFYATLFFYIQNRMKELGNSEFVIGIVLAASALFSAIVASNVYKLEKRMSYKSIITIFPLAAIGAFWLATIPGLERFALILISGIESVFFVSLGDHINKQIPSKQRATILSLQSMTFSFFMIILFPIVGKLGDIYGLANAFKFIAAASTLTLGALLLQKSKP